jgi:prolyl oligopeptidase
MRFSPATLLVLAVLAAGCAASEPPPPTTSAVPISPAPQSATLPPVAAFAYPPARRGDTVDDYHGVKIPDPYRWLEDLDSPETRAWLDAENRLTDSVLGAIPGRDALHERIATLSRVEAFGVPRRHGSRWFWTHHDAREEQWALFTAPSPDASPTMLLDPNAISKDGSLSFAGWSPSEDGNRLAYGLSIGGGDWERWRFRDVATGKDLPDELESIKYYAPQLTADGKGVYYSRFPAPPPGKELSETDHDCKVYFHTVGAPVASDVVVYARPEHPTWQMEPRITRDGRYVVVAIGDGQVGDRGVEQIVVLDLAHRPVKARTLVGAFEAEYVFAGSDGGTFYFKTTAGAARKRVVSIDVRGTDPAPWKEVVPEGPDAVEDVALAGRQIIVTTLKDARHAVAAYSLRGKKLREVVLPGLGTAWRFGGAPDAREVYFAFEGFTSPMSVHRYDLATGATRPWKAPVTAFDASSLETTQVFYPSKDGTKIPMFVVAKRGLAHDGRAPTLLTGYGGFGLSQTPYFDAPTIAWLERGGVFALANLRGGGEYGEAWHRVAIREHKQVVFDDFIAAAEWLESSGITSRDRLGIYGVSGGGLLVGAVTMQRPELFGAVAPLFGPHDMLRFPLFGQGAGWEGDFGSPGDPREFEALRAYSPLHNVHPGTRYPPTYIATADHDVRVPPLHSYKYAATLQAAQAGSAPILLRVETTSGHGGGRVQSSQIDQSTELLAFFAKTLGLALTSVTP